MTQSDTEYLQKKQREFLHKVGVAEQYISSVRDDLSASARQLKRFPAIEQGLKKEISGDTLARLANPIPAIWDELGRRAVNVSDPKQEYAFLQAVGTETMLYALQDTLLLLRAIQKNADVIRTGIQSLDDAGKLPPGISHQTLTELDRLLSAINLAAVDDNQGMALRFYDVHRFIETFSQHVFRYTIIGVYPANRTPRDEALKNLILDDIGRSAGTLSPEETKAIETLLTTITDYLLLLVLEIVSPENGDENQSLDWHDVLPLPSQPFCPSSATSLERSYRQGRQIFLFWAQSPDDRVDL
jgi:hypothetical protein